MSDASPERQKSPHSALFADGAEALDRYLASLPGSVERLERAHLDREYSGRQFLRGWRISVRFSDGVDRLLDILIGQAFPFLPPRIALADRSKFLVWPHVEHDGVLCLLEDNQSINYASPQAVLEHLLGLAVKLIEDCIAGRNSDHFLAECNSYWEHATSLNAPKVWSLVAMRPPSRPIVVWRNENCIVAADSSAVLTQWVENFRGSTSIAEHETVAGLFAWLPTPLGPSEFPQTGADVRKLLRARDGVALERLESLIGPDSREFYVLLGAPAPNGTFAGAIVLKKQPERRGYGAPPKGTIRGFRRERSDRIPREVVLSQLLGAHPATLARVERIDAPWVHGRNCDDRVAHLRAASVAVIGCGSLGSGVALALIQAGVGDMRLIDPDTLTAANISRHVLGLQHVGQKKALALANHLRSNFPHIRSVTGWTRSWQELREGELDELARHDLIVCTIGDINVERSINSWARFARPDRPMVYGWLEPFACAAHAVAISGKGGCLECGFDDLGRPNFFATEWAGVETVRREPGCAAVFQPYGSVELLSGVATVSEVALQCILGEVSESTHRIYVTSQQRLHKCGGSWSSMWTSLGQRLEGNLAYERKWEQSPTCRQCNKTSIQT